MRTNFTSSILVYPVVLFIQNSKNKRQILSTGLSVFKTEDCFPNSHQRWTIGSLFWISLWTHRFKHNIRCQSIVALILIDAHNVPFLASRSFWGWSPVLICLRLRGFLGHGTCSAKTDIVGHPRASPSWLLKPFIMTLVNSYWYLPSYMV